jgi:purine-cytosine permease-like protein
MAEQHADLDAAAIEQRTIAQVPLSERHGRVRDLFTIWFGSNVMLLTIVTGALATTVYGLSLAWAAAALVLGNLIDFYLVKHGHYDVPSFFRPDGGLDGLFNVPACAVYVIGVAVEVPFISTELYTGPIARQLSDVDLSWLIGLAVVCPLYYWAARRFLRGQTVSATPTLVDTAGASVDISV